MELASGSKEDCAASWQYADNEDEVKFDSVVHKVAQKHSGLLKDKLE